MDSIEFDKLTEPGTALSLDRRRFMEIGLKAGLGLVAGPSLISLIEACGSGTSSQSTSGAPAGKRGGTLRYAVAAGGAATPDPAQATRTLALAIAANCYNTLAVADTDFNLTPSLATEWSGNSNATSWTFKLRSGVKFHDGSPLTSKDVAYTFSRILDPATAATGLSALKPYLAASGIETPDATTVKFNLLQPNAFFPVTIAAVGYSIVKSGSTDFSTGNGTGPFSLKSFDPNARLSLVRADSYWEHNLPYLDGIEYVVIAEDATRLQSLTSGSQDFVDNITGASTKLLVGNVDAFMIKTGGWFGLTMFGDTTPFNNPKVIQAMQYAADRHKIASVVAPGIDIITPDVPVPPSDPFFPSDLKAKAYDPEKAKSLLKDAGFSSGLNIDIYAYEGDKLDTAVSYKSTAAAAGINVNVVNWPHATFFTDVFKKRPAIGISVARLHIAQALARLYTSSGDLNLTHYNDSSLNSLILQATATTNQSTQKQIFGEALKKINDSAANVIPGWEGQVYGKGKKVTGVVAANGGVIYLKTASFQ